MQEKLKQFYRAHQREVNRATALCVFGGFAVLYGARLGAQRTTVDTLGVFMYNETGEKVFRATTSAGVWSEFPYETLVVCSC